MKKETKDSILSFFKYRFGAAVAVLVLMIVLSVTIGANLSLWNMRNRLSGLYEDDVSTVFRQSALYAEELCSISRNCGIADSGADTSNLSAAIETVCKNDTPYLAAGTADDLFRCSLTVYKTVISAGTASKNQLSEATDALRNINDAMLALCGNEPYTTYNKRADNYNKALGAPLAGLFLGDPQPAVSFSKIAKTYAAGYEEALEKGSIYDIGFLADITQGWNEIVGNAGSHIVSFFDGIGSTIGAAMVIALVLGLAAFIFALIVLSWILKAIFGSDEKPKQTNPYYPQNGNNNYQKTNKNPYSSHVKTSFDENTSHKGNLR